MLAKINSAAIVGLDAVPVEVEVDIASQGLPSFTKVGTQCQNLSFGRIYKLWGGEFWSDGYYISTVGRHKSEDAIMTYVREQGRGKEYAIIHKDQLKLGL